jgi:hypothetical protein
MLNPEKKFFTVIVAFSFLTTSGVIYHLKFSNSNNSKSSQYGPILSQKYPVRDFQRYKCDDIRRIGGLAKFVTTAKNNKSRIDGNIIFVRF